MLLSSQSGGYCAADTVTQNAKSITIPFSATDGWNAKAVITEDGIARVNAPYSYGVTFNGRTLGYTLNPTHTGSYGGGGGTYNGYIFSLVPVKKGDVFTLHADYQKKYRFNYSISLQILIINIYNMQKHSLNIVSACLLSYTI